MKKFSKNVVKCLIFVSMLLIQLNCATVAEKEPSKESNKAKKLETETVKESFITKLKPELLNDRSMISIKADGPLQYTAFKLSDPLRLIIDFSDTRIEGRLKEPIQFNQGAINSITSQYFDESNITRVVIGLDRNIQYDINKIKKDELNINIAFPDKIPTIAVDKNKSTDLNSENIAGAISKDEDSLQNAGLEDDTSGEEEKKFTGQLISLDFQNADIKSILRLIAEINGYNLITAPEVKGKVNLNLKNVPWDQVLDLLLKTYRLGMEKDGNIIRIASLKRLGAEKKALADLEKAKDQGEELVSETINVSYAKLTEIKKILDGIKSGRGKITTDERTQTLIIYDIKSKIDEMMELIAILDKRTKQVSIEAKIVEVNKNFTRELGIQWGGSFARTTNKVFPNTVQVAGGGASNYIVDLPAATGSGAGAAIGLSLGSLTGATLLDVALSAMEDSGNGKIISNPKITTLNNRAAIISSGRRIPYETSSAEGPVTLFVDAAISLTVTPHITPDGFIRLEISSTKNEADFGNTGASGAPTILTNEANAEVLIRNGDTTALGGLFSITTSSTTKGVPFFSKIPFLGYLFKSERNEKVTSELLIFITPRIVENL